MKKDLVDLSILKHINCVLGQIAYNYARFFGHMNEYLRIYREVLNNQKSNGYPCE